jgi:hypothetical protein
MPEWRRRKKGSPRQIGQPFIVDESSQKKKGALSKLRERFAGNEHGRQENEHLERLKALIKEHTTPTEEKMLNGVITEADAEYLERKGLIKIDPMTEDISLTDKGTVYFLGKQMQRNAIEAKKNQHVSLTAQEKAWLRKKVDEDEEI